MTYNCKRCVRGYVTLRHTQLARRLLISEAPISRGWALRDHACRSLGKDHPWASNVSRSRYQW